VAIMTIPGDRYWITSSAVADGWKVEGKQRIVGHGGCGGRQMHIAIRFLPIDFDMNRHPFCGNLLISTLQCCHERSWGRKTYFHSVASSVMVCAKPNGTM
jgi:hypothetical protein